MKKLTILIVLALLAGCGNEPYRNVGDVKKDCRTDSQKYYISDSFSEEDRQEVEDAFTTYNNAIGCNYFVFSGLDQNGDNGKNIVYLEDFDSVHHGWATAYENRWTIRMSPRCIDKSETCLYTVMIHEIGHVLGFDHVQNDNCVMNVPIYPEFDFEACGYEEQIKERYY